MNKIALVTGANRGIGFEVCRQLGQQGFEVILTSRDTSKGEKASQVLQGEGYQVIYHPLEVTDLESINQMYDFVVEEFGRLDVLVNNAGVYLDEGVSALEVPLKTFYTTFDINFYGPYYLCRQFIPLMELYNYGRVVNVSSDYGAIASMGGDTAAYRISKTALNTLTIILADELKKTNIKVNTMCPGWVKTEMGGQAAPRTIPQGADTIVWLATLPDDGPTGGFFKDRQLIPW